MINKNDNSFWKNLENNLEAGYKFFEDWKPIIAFCLFIIIFSLIIIIEVFQHNYHVYTDIITLNDGTVYHARDIEKKNNGFVKFITSENLKVQITRYSVKEIKHVGLEYDK